MVSCGSPTETETSCGPRGRRETGKGQIMTSNIISKIPQTPYFSLSKTGVKEEYVRIVVWDNTNQNRVL